MTKLMPSISVNVNKRDVIISEENMAEYEISDEGILQNMNSVDPARFRCSISHFYLW